MLLNLLAKATTCDVPHEKATPYNYSHKIPASSQYISSPPPPPPPPPHPSSSK